MALSEPTQDDLQRLAKQWVHADGIVSSRAGEGLDQTASDLNRIQVALDSESLSATDTYDLQCLGVALGRVLAANVEGLDWAVIDDDYGRDPTIRYRETTLVFNVLTMISKRIEAGESVDVQGLYDSTCQHLEELRDEVD